MDLVCPNWISERCCIFWCFRQMRISFQARVVGIHFWTTNFEPANFVRECAAVVSAFDALSILIVAFIHRVIEGFTPQIVSSLQVAAFAGLTVDQIKSLPPASASGMTGAQLMGLLSDRLEALTVEFVARTDVPVWRNLNAEKMSHLNATAGLSRQMIQQIHPSAFRGVRAEQLSELSIDRSGFHSCKGLSSMQVGQIPAISMSGFRDVCITATNFTCWSNVSASQIEALNPQACAGFRWFHMGNIPRASYSGFSAACLQYISSQDRRVCYGMQDEGVTLIKPAAFAGFQPECAIAVFLPTVTAQQLSYVNLDTMSVLNNYTIASLNPQAFSGLSADQLSVLQCGQFGSCRSITTAQISHIRTGSMIGFTPDCVRCSTANAWRDITAEQLAGFSSSTCAALSSLQRVLMSASTFAGYRNECISLSDPESWFRV
jgi:trimeric autotransporter adhesin